MDTYTLYITQFMLNIDLIFVGFLKISYLDPLMIFVADWQSQFFAGDDVSNHLNNV